MEPPQGGSSQLAFFSNHTYRRVARFSFFSQPCTGKCRLRYRHFFRNVFGNRHRRYPASSAPHRTAKPDDVAFSFGWVERKLVREAPCFLGPVMRCQQRFNELVTDDGTRPPLLARRSRLQRRYLPARRLARTLSVSPRTRR